VGGHTRSSTGQRPKSRVRGGVRGPQPGLRTRGLTMPARRDRLETRGAARDGAVAHKCPLQKMSRLDGRLTHKILARRQRAQGHKWPRSTTLSRSGSSTARWLAHRQGVHDDVPRRCRVITVRDQGRGEVKTATAALTLGRRCSRGRLGEDDGAV
jgi:hypothetical protein